MLLVSSGCYATGAEAFFALWADVGGLNERPPDDPVVPPTLIAVRLGPDGILEELPGSDGLLGGRLFCYARFKCCKCGDLCEASTRRVPFLVGLADICSDDLLEAKLRAARSLLY